MDMLGLALDIFGKCLIDWARDGLFDVGGLGVRYFLLDD